LALFGSMRVATSPLAAEYLAGETGILPIIGYGLLAAWLVTRTSSRQATAVVRQGVALARGAHAAP
jgi:hypothetical protein